MPSPPHKKQKVDMDATVNVDEELKFIQKVCCEKEPVARKNKPITPNEAPTFDIVYISTPRAYMAQRGYLAGKTLGSGTYSKVKVALDLRNRHSPQQVAIKIIDKSKAQADYQDRFLPRELEVWPTLQHPNLINFIEVFQCERMLYMALEYAPNGDALKYVQDHGIVDEDIAQKWMQQVCGAVNYMHTLDIAHRDLKLENLLITRDMDIKICDFGFIKPESSVEHSQTFCGSKSYAAPEILRGKTYDPKKSDVWAVGVILYILVTAKMPFDEAKGTPHLLKEMKAMTSRGPRDRNLSPVCMDLLSYIFTWEFAARPSIVEVINHPWIIFGPALDIHNARMVIPTKPKEEPVPRRAKSDCTLMRKE